MLVKSVFLEILITGGAFFCLIGSKQMETQTLDVQIKTIANMAGLPGSVIEEVFLKLGQVRKGRIAPGFELLRLMDELQDENFYK